MLEVSVLEVSVLEVSVEGLVCLLCCHIVIHRRLVLSRLYGLFLYGCKG